MIDQQPARPTAQPKDNLLGICNAIGEDFGFNPLWLRLALGALFVLQPVGVVVAYLALGMVVLVSRIVLPTSRRRVRTAQIGAQAVANGAANEPAFARAA